MLLSFLLWQTKTSVWLSKPPTLSWQSVIIPFTPPFPVYTSADGEQSPSFCSSLSVGSSLLLLPSTSPPITSRPRFILFLLLGLKVGSNSLLQLTEGWDQEILTSSLHADQTNMRHMNTRQGQNGGGKNKTHWGGGSWWVPTSVWAPEGWKALNVFYFFCQNKTTLTLDQYIISCNQSLICQKMINFMSPWRSMLHVPDCQKWYLVLPVVLRVFRKKKL